MRHRNARAGGCVSWAALRPSMRAVAAALHGRTVLEAARSAHTAAAPQQKAAHVICLSASPAKGHDGFVACLQQEGLCRRGGKGMPFGSIAGQPCHSSAWHGHSRYGWEQPPSPPTHACWWRCRRGSGRWLRPCALPPPSRWPPMRGAAGRSRWSSRRRRCLCGVGGGGALGNSYSLEQLAQCCTAGRADWGPSSLATTKGLSRTGVCQFGQQSSR